MWTEYFALAGHILETLPEYDDEWFKRRLAQIDRDWPPEDYIDFISRASTIGLAFYVRWCGDITYHSNVNRLPGR